jgi:hypothetical protein
MSTPASPTDLRCTDAEGLAYRSGVYHPLDEAALPPAPDAPHMPDRGSGPPFRVHNEVPRVPKLRHLIGPSVIALGMGLGSGEFLLWPNLITANGYSIWWLFWVGVITQFIALVEIERWTIATGESIFGGMARLGRYPIWPWFFLVATLAGFFWPGWASQSGEFTADIIAEATGRRIAWQPIALVMMAVIWTGLAISKIVYNALERFQIGLVLLFFPMLLVTLFLVGVLPSDVTDLAIGAVSLGSAPSDLLTGAQFPTLLLAVAYAGSGGTLLLAQSLWLRDKGFGMAAYQGRIAGVRGKNEEVSETGYVFDSKQSPISLARFREWMRLSQQELLVTFVGLIILSVVITSLVVTATLGTGNTELAGNYSEMVRQQGAQLAQVAGKWLEIVFLLGGAFVLFSTQLGIVDTVTRIAGSIFYERYGRYTKFWTLKRTFLFFLTVFVLASMAIVLMSWFGGKTIGGLQPDFLVVIAGPFTIASMYVFALVIGYMNARRLPPEIATPVTRRVGMMWAALLWGWFTVEQISRAILAGMGAPADVVGSIVLHPVRVVLYAGFIASLIWFAWALFAVPPRGAKPTPSHSPG